jgi:superfamily I DNA and/or RNA helicase
MSMWWIRKANLDECLAATLLQRSLDWHYRSQFESLINLSNSQYYQGRLVTFPSSVTEDKAVRAGSCGVNPLTYGG